MTFAEFLLARIAEDEEVADRIEFRPYLGEGVPESLTDRVLADCEAKRRIVVRCGEDQLSGIPALVHHANQTLHELASVYADHPDYRDEWRV